MVNIAYAGKMGTGKTTAAGLLSEKLQSLGLNTKIVSLATPLKEIHKDWVKPISTHDSKKPRAEYQRLGESFRAYDKDFFIKHLLNNTNESNISYICDDVRFKNEVESLQEHGWHVIKITSKPKDRRQRINQEYGDGAKEHLNCFDHPSEKDLDNYQWKENQIIRNTSDITTLAKSVNEKLDSILDI